MPARWRCVPVPPRRAWRSSRIMQRTFGVAEDAATWPARPVGCLGVVVVALRELDEGACLLTDGPSVMAWGKQHHVPG